MLVEFRNKNGFHIEYVEIDVIPRKRDKVRFLHTHFRVIDVEWIFYQSESKGNVRHFEIIVHLEEVK